MRREVVLYHQWSETHNTSVFFSEHNGRFLCETDEVEPSTKPELCVFVASKRDASKVCDALNDLISKDISITKEAIEGMNIMSIEDDRPIDGEFSNRISKLTDQQIEAVNKMISEFEERNKCDVEKAALAFNNAHTGTPGDMSRYVAFKYGAHFVFDKFENLRLHSDNCETVVEMFSNWINRQKRCF